VYETLSDVQQGLLRTRSIHSANPDSATLAALWDTPPSPAAEPEYKFNLIGRHFLDSSEQRLYAVTDVFFDDQFQQWVCRRAPVDGAPSVDTDTDTFLLDYVYREMSLHPDISSYTPRTNTESFKCQQFKNEVALELPVMLSSGALREGDLELIPDEHGDHHYYRRQIDNNFDEVLQLIIPADPVLKTLILNSAHDCLGHGKLFRMEEFITRRVWWPKLRADITEFLLSCPRCQTVGPIQDRRASSYPLLRHPEVWRPWQRISIDYKGPLPKSGARNLYIVAAVDHFTKFLVARAVPEQSAETTA
jgi:hypothetical protein